jgi:iron-sulfur cluster assembly accessory protein
MAELPPALTLTERAAERVRVILGERGKPSAGLRVGIDEKGCSGLAYKIEYADEASPLDQVVTDKGVTIFVELRAIMFLIGSEMDYVTDTLQSGFVFNNPNAKGSCGCGESFHV